MKNMICAALLLLAACAFTACEKEADLPVLTEDEYPRIFGNWPAKDSETGALGTHSAQLGTELVIEVEYTPSAFCTAVWYLDGVEYCRGPVFRYTSGSPVVHYLRLEVSTPRHTTYRESQLIVE